jgi:hypothetical protein
VHAQDAIVPFTALLMLGLIWVRTRVQYSGKAVGALRLQRAGQIYFAAAVAVLVLGWFVAPALGRAFWPVPGVTATLVRVVWCLGTYYVFIIIHRIMKARGNVVFSADEPAAVTPR